MDNIEAELMKGEAIQQGENKMKEFFEDYFTRYHCNKGVYKDRPDCCYKPVYLFENKHAADRNLSVAQWKEELSKFAKTKHRNIASYKPIFASCKKAATKPLDIRGAMGTTWVETPTIC